MSGVAAMIACQPRSCAGLVDSGAVSKPDEVVSFDVFEVIEGGEDCGSDSQGWMWERWCGLWFGKNYRSLVE